jgi:hypothetical protein
MRLLITNGFTIRKGIPLVLASSRTALDVVND